MRSLLIAAVVITLVCVALAQQSPSPAGSPPVAAASPSAVVSPSPDVVPVTSASGALTWLIKLQSGGWVVWAQIFLSVIAGGYAVGCWTTIRKHRIMPEGLVGRARQLWKAGEVGKLEALGQSEPSTMSRAISFMVEHRENNISEVSTASGDLAEGEISKLLSRCYPIAVIANLEPLLGLLGTVFGMIDCFDVVAVAGELGNPSLLASGISKALVTTAVGLTLAIPLLYLYHHFKAKLTGYSNDLEQNVNRLTAEWFMKKSDRTNDTAA